MFIPLRIRRETHYYQNVSSSQLDLQIQVISVKIPASYFVSIDKLILKFIWRGKRLRIANSVLKEKNNFGGLTLPDIKIYYKVMVPKTACY